MDIIGIINNEKYNSIVREEGVYKSFLTDLCKSCQEEIDYVERQKGEASVMNAISAMTKFVEDNYALMFDDQIQGNAEFDLLSTIYGFYMRGKSIDLVMNTIMQNGCYGGNGNPYDYCQDYLLNLVWSCGKMIPKKGQQKQCNDEYEFENQEESQVFGGKEDSDYDSKKVNSYFSDKSIPQVNQNVPMYQQNNQYNVPQYGMQRSKSYEGLKKVPANGDIPMVRAKRSKSIGVSFAKQ